MTRVSPYYVLLVIIALLYFIFSTNQVSCVLFCFFAALGIFSFAYIRYVKSQLRTSLNYPDKIYYAGDTICWDVTVDSDLPVPYCTLTLDTSQLPTLPISRKTSSIGLFSNCSIKNSAAFPQRGSFKLSYKEIHIEDSFRLFSQTINVHAAQKELTVFPRLYDVSELLRLGHDIYCDELSITHGRENPSHIKNLRPYKTGDSLKKIHWKQSARQRSLIVKNLDKTSGEQISLCVHLHKSNYEFNDNGASEERIVDVAASLAFCASQQDISIEVYFNNARRSEYKISSSRLFEEFYKDLPYITSDGTLSLQDFLSQMKHKIDQGSRIFVIHAEQESDLIEQINREFSNRGGVSNINCLPHSTAPLDKTSFFAASLLHEHRRLYI